MLPWAVNTNADQTKAITKEDKPDGYLEKHEASENAKKGQTGVGIGSTV